ncbi:helicase ARIP4-like [Paramacrobiotus metropolitanus]|uniref:helicase ARIP4-like n=1 Tax=Paramacrobiotus metropolitanus TaxID=2943436 RepID=UPI00244574DD|nr:helicase ARIP4-like [Paramacrobiotus metropolitanus]
MESVKENPTLSSSDMFFAESGRNSGTEEEVLADCEILEEDFASSRNSSDHSLLCDSSSCTSEVNGDDTSQMESFYASENLSNGHTEPFSMSPSFRELDALLGETPADLPDPPLKKIEDFVSKSLAKKMSARRNIRNVKSLKELNPETRKAMEEENAKISAMELGQKEAVVDLENESDDIEIVEVRNENRSTGSGLRSENSAARSNGDVVCMGSYGAYPSISSFHCDDAANIPDENGQILINVNRMKREPCIYVADQLVPHLRPHQIGGIRFMYATLIESISKFTNSPGNGAVLAHSMGLGKTLQVITFLDAIFRDTPVKSVLIVAPLNTMAHWMAEFAKWVPPESRHERMKVICIRDQKAAVRSALIEGWSEEGGVLLMGYEKLRSIVEQKGGKTGGEKGKKRNRDHVDDDSLLVNGASSAAPSTEEDIDLGGQVMQKCEIIICDEGHRIKSAGAAITKILKKVKTKRRLILTGYPLQNNLMEYWCMIDFVRPFLLGNESEFGNLFKNPIENGQCADSSDADRRLMRYRTYILQRTLSRIVQRRDSRPLIAELPKKREFALIFRQTPAQTSLYKSVFEELIEHGESLNAVALYATFRSITQHPAIFFAHVKKLVNSAVETSGQIEVMGPIRQFLVNMVQEGKWERFLTNYDTFKHEEILSGKILFLKILISEAVVKRKEKIIVFSQSIDVLDYLQEYLPALLPARDEKQDSFPVCFRIDGSTSSHERERMINLFNDENDPTQIFLISTDAGGIGINLTGGNRVVILDVSWNPSKDIQAISRIYRYGQNKISTVYRLVGDGSMERCVFDRQIHKQFLFKRVVDDKSPMLAINQADLGSLFRINDVVGPEVWHKICRSPFPDEAKEDDILSALDTSDMFRQYLAEAPMVMDSILEADDSAQLSDLERREAEANFLREKRPGDSLSASRRPYHPISNIRQFYPSPQFSGGAGMYRAHMPLPHGSMGMTQFPGLRPAPPKAQHIPLEQAVLDSALVKEIRERVAKREDFCDLIQRYAQPLQGRVIRHTIPDPQGNPSIVYSLHAPGVAAYTVFRMDGMAYRMINNSMMMPSHPPPQPMASSSRSVPAADPDPNVPTQSE